MFLRNYYNIMARLNISLIKDVGDVFGDGSLSYKDVTGTIRKIIYEEGLARAIPSIGDIQYIGQPVSAQAIGFGTGNEPVTFDDYNLGTMITSGLTGQLVKAEPIQYDSVNKKYYSLSKYTLNNTSASDVVIREYGLFVAPHVTNNAYQRVLIYRELLEPYTLSSGESVNVLLNYSYTMPTIDESGNVVAGSQAYGLSID